MKWFVEISFVFSGNAAFDDDAVQLLQTRVAAKKSPCKDVLNCGYDLTTSDGQNHCLIQESSLWSYDCNGANGRIAFAPKMCTDYPFTGRICCPTDCIPADEPVLDLATSEGATTCLTRWMGQGWNYHDCSGSPGKVAAAKLPHYCNTTRIVPQICCKNECDLLVTGTTAAPPMTTTKKPDVPTTPTTTIPGGDTNPGGPDCFGAIASWGPDFDCNEKSDMFCGNDSPDGLDVSMCCQEHCGTNQEKRSKKKEAEGDRKKSEGARKSARAESTKKRKEAESARKKQKKEDEWLSKRSEQEKKNKSAEDERKNKRGFSESQTKKERAWKKGRKAVKTAAERRERKRKESRKENGRKVSAAEKKKKRKANHKKKESKKKR